MTRPDDLPNLPAIQATSAGQAGRGLSLLARPFRQSRRRMARTGIGTGIKAALFAGMTGLWAAAPAHAQSGADVGIARPWQTGMQDPASPIMERIISLHDSVLTPIIFGVAIFVTVLLGWACFRFRESANPTPSKTSHNTLLEVAWTGIPVLILIVIAVPSFRQLYHAEVIPPSDMTLKIVGRQWYWTYQYPDHGNFEFDSYMLSREEAKAQGGIPLLSVDNEVVLPVNTTVRLQMTASDVLHNWAVPAFGLKMDTVPGRLNETWVRPTRTGKFYGQCSELCGAGHGYMPIVVNVVSKAEFDSWIATQQAKLLPNPAATPVAATTPDPQRRAETGLVAASRAGTAN